MYQLFFSWKWKLDIKIGAIKMIQIVKYFIINILYIFVYHLYIYCSFCTFEFLIDA